VLVTAVQGFVIGGCLCVFAVLPRAADAQVTPPPVPASPQPQGPATRPVRPLFGVSVGSFEQSLDVAMGMGGSYERERVRFTTTTSGDLIDDVRTGGSGFGNARLGYSINRGRFGGGASARVSGFYYHQFDSRIRVNSGGSFYGGLRLWSGAAASAVHDLTYAPYHFTALSPAELIELQQGNPLFDPSTLVQSSLHQRTSATFEQAIPLTRRVSASAGYAFHGDRRGSSWGYERHEMRTGVTVGLTRGISARAGYQYGMGRPRSSGGSWSQIQTIDSGINFNRQLSFSRRLRLSFGTGFATIGDLANTYYTMTGNVRLSWSISRTWSASVGFNRDAQFFDDLQSIGVSNRVQSGVGGPLTRRMSLHGSVGMSSMDHGSGQGDNRVRWIYGNLGLSTRLGSHLSVGVDYSNSYYSFGDAIVLFPGVPQHRHRQAVQGRVTVAAPLYLMMTRRR
jgi:hypothetical protein